MDEGTKHILETQIASLTSQLENQMLLTKIERQNRIKIEKTLEQTRIQFEMEISLLSDEIQRSQNAQKMLAYQLSQSVCSKQRLERLIDMQFESYKVDTQGVIFGDQEMVLSSQMQRELVLSCNENDTQLFE
ncbi:hypothetical protein SS50377_20729 [Spironucleus salmonicida]|uniref:Uncharacterized protein n=1 Tax=Spironucleus salmonicida TaxID=348837 RepID=V6LWC7_9EUKA|nr:hypothetical protein SS50377_20729 [Spironucleus salmonicida]|eukprot:EST48932.1 Hypothetical protein SS50377_10837 [Spironucleus salmonicida]